MPAKPQTLTIWWCPECGLVDRLGRLSKHWSQGFLCMGHPEPLTYTLAGAR